MKKKYLLCAASLLLISPLALMSACTSTPELTLSSNWFSDTSTKIIPADFKETLTYGVSFEKSAAAENGEFSVDYRNGTYTTTLHAGEKDGAKTYVYTTQLNIQAQYTLNGQTSDTFSESVTTRVEFLDVANRLKPLSSTRTVDASAPLCSPTSAPDTLSEAFERYHYTTEITYNGELDKATYAITDLATGEKNSEEIKLGGSGSFFDNEEILVMLRAAELSSSMTFRTLDPTTRTVEKIKVKDGPNAETVKKSVKLKTDTEAVEREFSVFTLSIAYDKANAGGTQRLTYVQRGDRDHNDYRNVLLVYTYPVIYSHGTLTYQLTSADFYG